MLTWTECGLAQLEFQPSWWFVCGVRLYTYSALTTCPWSACIVSPVFAADQVSPLFIAVDDLPKLPYAELLLTTVVLTPAAADHVHHHQYLQEPVGPGHLLLADHLTDFLTLQV